MTPVIPSSISNISLLPGNAFITRKANSSTRGSRLTLWTKQRDDLPRFMPIRVFPNNRICSALNYRFRHHILSATGTDVAVEAQDSPPVLEESSGPSTDADEPSKETSIKSETNPRRSRPPRKSEMPPVKNEELTPGATFSGKVRSIQPFGAFVDFGAFTDGLVHVSQLSNSFVQDVGSVVSIGQEVKVRLLEANMETGRISLSMRESDDGDNAPDGGDKPRGPRRKAEPKKTSKFVIGQDLTGTVKKMNRAGAYISLPEEEEGFLPVSEESDDGFESLMGNTSLEVGQEVQVRVLRITRGQATLTMKKEEDLAKLDLELSQGSKHTATNPFVLAFQKNKEISAFLSERKKPEQSGDAAIPDEVQVAAESKTDSSTYGDAEASKETIVGEGKLDDASLVSEEGPVTDEAKSDEAPEPSGEITNEISRTVTPTEDAALESKPETISTEDEQQAEEVAVVVDEVTAPVPIENLTVDEATSPKDEEQAEAAPVVVAEATPAKDEQQAEEAPIVVDEATLAKDERQAEEAPVVENEATPAKDEQQVDEAPVVVDEATPVKNEQEVEEAPVVVDQPITEKDEEQAAEAPVLVDEVTATVPIAENKVEASTEENGTLSGSAIVSPALVKQLREETGAGMMDCKKALAEAGGDLVKAQEFLRKKGLASADKKASRATAEGRIGSYIHDSRIGVLVEVNCETDFVSRGEIFKELADDLAMQVAACPQVQYLVTEDVPVEIVGKEKEIEMQKEDLLSKPEQIREKIVEGRIRKRLEELALLEQPYIKNDKVVVKDWVKQTIATIGENIKVKRFVRFNLGEGLEKKSQDFAAEVAAQTAAKPPPSPKKEEPAAVETVEKAPTVAVSAALVKQLREETGAGMMDCKKALSETGGDLEKAQEYLRKKGLSAADKKSSRLAAEGRIGSYIHDSRIGVLIEVNCETDFVGRSEKFKELVDDLAMQVVACPQVEFVSLEEVPESVILKEKELEMQREDLQSKPENIRERIVEGRVSKRLGELALLEQPFIKDDSILVKDLVKQTVAAIGENIKVRRFVRFTLGETTEDEK